MTIRITFDTNVLDYACRPERYPKDRRQPKLQAVRDALVGKRIEGFYSVAMLTIEGIMREDRADVFANTRLTPGPEKISTKKNAELRESVRAVVGSADVDAVEINYVVDQPNRKPLHPEVVARVRAAKALGVRTLKAVPRLGAYHIEDPNKEFYLDIGDDKGSLGAWVEKIHGIAREIECRNLGFAQVKGLGARMACDPAEAWFMALENAKDIHEERAVERAFSEWADGDAVAADLAYGLGTCSAPLMWAIATRRTPFLTPRTARG